MRFRKSIKLAPGIRMNLSGSGLSWTLGPRGASLGIGKRGAYANFGIPGTGISTRQRLTSGSRAPARKAAAPSVTSVAASITVQDDGTVTFKDEQGTPLSDALIRAAKKQHGDAIRDMIERACQDINEQVDGLAALHLYTPSPDSGPSLPPAEFSEPAPVMQALRKPGFLDRLLKRRAAAVRAENERMRVEHEADMVAWRERRSAFEQDVRRRESLLAMARAGRPTAMELWLEETLQDIVWPRETLVSLEVSADGAKLYFDVDLPEIEDMPTKAASVPQRGYKMTVKELGRTRIQQLYAQHIHSIAFRLVGEAFAALPTLEEVFLSGYSQRANAATGVQEDQYLLAVRVTRREWAQISFDRLGAVEVTEALARFELRRQMTKAGVFKPVLPFLAADLLVEEEALEC